MNYREINAETIDRWIEEGWEWGKPIDHETFVRAAKGDRFRWMRGYSSLPRCCRPLISFLR